MSASSQLLNENKPKSKHETKKLIKKFFQSNSLIDQLLNQFFLPKQHDYDQNILKFYAITHKFIQTHHDISNYCGQKLYASVFRKSHLTKLPQTFIVYCHGYGSTRLESSRLLKVIPEQFGLCCFDFSGQGKSEGQIITYGAKEKEDIDSVIKYLQNQLAVKRFVLWGRSMGATVCLNYTLSKGLKCMPENQTNQHNKKSKIFNKNQNISRNVIFQIVDSPFISFQKIAIEMGKKFAKVPQFGSGIILDILKKKCAILGQYNPFTVNLQQISQCKVPTAFIYSQNDEIVSYKNSEQLCSKFTAFFQKIHIPQKHNMPRSVEILSQMMKKIQIQIKKTQINQKNGLNFKSFISKNSTKSYSNKKGIQRSIRKNYSILESLKSGIKNNDYCDSEYGLKIQSKAQTPNPHKYFIPKQANQNIQNAHVTNYNKKKISFTTMPHDYDFKNYQSPFIQFPNQSPQKKQLQTVKSQIFKSQNYQNTYQMKKPVINKNTNLNVTELKRNSSPLNPMNYSNPLNNLALQPSIYQANNNKSYRQNHRRPQSQAPRKLNISLSKLKDVKQKFTTDNKPQNYSVMNKQFTKQLYSPTPLTRPSSLSSSMDNLHFIGINPKASMLIKPVQSCKKSTYFMNNDQNIRKVHKMRSSQIIYYDRKDYRYGL